MKNRSRGFTLMELMIVIALAAVILGVGVPSFREFLRNNKMASVANDLLGGIQTARTEAIKRQLPTGGIAICPSDNPDDDAATCLDDDVQQFNGWIAFVDADNNCERDTDTEDLIRTGSRVDLDNTPASYVNSASNGSCISFASTGFMRTDTGRPAATRTVYCDERGNVVQPGMNISLVRGIDVSATGRARVTRDVAEIAGFGVGCPGAPE
jgi:type IV fimbrial biogenesis protein FimT